MAIASSRRSISASLRPALFIWRGHPANRAQMLELPLAVDFYVIVLVARGQPYGAITLAKRERPHEIPTALAAIAVHLDNRIHHVVLREADAFLEALEKRANRRMPRMASNL